MSELKTHFENYINLKDKFFTTKEFNPLYKELTKYYNDNNNDNDKLNKFINDINTNKIEIDNLLLHIYTIISRDYNDIINKYNGNSNKIKFMITHDKLLIPYCINLLYNILYSIKPDLIKNKIKELNINNVPILHFLVISYPNLFTLIDNDISYFKDPNFIKFISNIKAENTIKFLKESINKINSIFDYHYNNIKEIILLLLCNFTKDELNLDVKTDNKEILNLIITNIYSEFLGNESIEADIMRNIALKLKSITEIQQNFHKISFLINEEYKILINDKGIFYNELTDFLDTNVRFKNFINKINIDKKLDIQIYNKTKLFEKYPYINKSFYYLDKLKKNILNSIKCKGINNSYYEDLINNCFDKPDEYDLLVIYNKDIPIAFTSIHKGDCPELPDLYVKYLTCANTISGVPLGSLLQALYLITSKLKNLDTGVLQLANGFKNVDAFCLNDRYGFRPNYLYDNPGCFNNQNYFTESIKHKEKFTTSLLSMEVKLNDITIDNILDVLFDVNLYLESPSIKKNKAKFICKNYYKSKKNILNNKDYKLDPNLFEYSIKNLVENINAYLTLEHDDNEIHKYYNKKKEDEIFKILINYITKPFITSHDINEVYNFTDNLSSKIKEHLEDSNLENILNNKVNYDED